MADQIIVSTIDWLVSASMPEAHCNKQQGDGMARFGEIQIPSYIIGWIATTD
jgi:hypothetical protein